MMAVALSTELGVAWGLFAPRGIFQGLAQNLEFNTIFSPGQECLVELKTKLGYSFHTQTGKCREATEIHFERECMQSKSEVFNFGHSTYTPDEYSSPKVGKRQRYSPLLPKIYLLAPYSRIR
jgi:hypothetical protein